MNYKFLGSISLEILKITKNLSFSLFFGIETLNFKKMFLYCLKDFEFCNFKIIKKYKFQIKNTKIIGDFLLIKIYYTPYSLNNI